MLRLGIKRRSSLIQQQHFWLPNKGPSNRHPLLLATRKLNTSLADHSVVPQGEYRSVFNEFEGIGLLACLVNILISHNPVVKPVDNIISDRTREKDGLLLNYSYVLFVRLRI